MINPKQWLQQISDSRRNFFKEYSDIFQAFEYCKKYSTFYNGLIKSKVANASKEIFGTEVPEGVTIFSFGAPSRNEMMGGSDADVAIYRVGKSNKELKFREKLIKSLEGFQFTKIDTPIWGTLNEIQRYMTTSVTEANQVMEAQFICGDDKLREKVEQLRYSLYDKDIIARNLVFQFFYFEQYFRKKASENYLNLKYCNGGSRDLLFPMWYAQLKKGIETNLQTTSFERGLNVLFEEGEISQKEVTDIMQHASAITLIRDEIMNISPGDMDGKLYLQKAIEVCKQKPHLFKKPEEITKIVREARPKVSDAKTKVWESLCNYFSTIKSEEWNIYFKKALENKNLELPLEFEHDEIINTIQIWNINDQNAEQSINYIKDISDSDSWIILASLLSSPYISGDVIDSIIKRKGLTPGYEYFLEIAARNPNLKIDTLEFIVTNDITEKRFKKPALKLAKELGI